MLPRHRLHLFLVFIMFAATIAPGEWSVAGSSNNEVGDHDIFLPIVQLQNWKTIEIPLYRLRLSLPLDWNLFEINRRPEPVIPGYPQKGHDCADYIVTSPDGKTVLNLNPTCGVWESFPSPWPADGVIVKEKAAKSWVIRFWEKSANACVYADAGMAEISDSSGTRYEKVRTDPANVAIGTSRDLILLRIETRLTGITSCQMSTIDVIDGIIRSLNTY